MSDGVQVSCSASHATARRKASPLGTMGGMGIGLWQLSPSNATDQAQRSVELGPLDPTALSTRGTGVCFRRCGRSRTSLNHHDRLVELVGANVRNASAVCRAAPGEYCTRPSAVQSPFARRHASDRAISPSLSFSEGVTRRRGGRPQRCGLAVGPASAFIRT
jgi:hypothetical protein